MTSSQKVKKETQDKAVPTAQQLIGQQAEALALAYLQGQGLTLLEKNFRCKTGEIDLILRDASCLVFVEVRSRKHARYGGAAASVTPAKQARLIAAAQVYLQRHRAMPACRFDVIALEGAHVHWLKNVIET